MREQTMNLLISTNAAYLAPTRTMLYSLFVHHDREEITIYMPYSDLSEEEVEELRFFVESFERKQLYPILISKDFSDRVESHNGISIETYYRILAIDLLPKDIDRILYLDVDLVIQGSLMELYRMQMENHPFLVCEDILGILNGFHEANKGRMSIPKEYSYFNAGVMLFNLEYLRNTNASDQILQRIYQNYHRYEYNDQDVLNEMYYDQVLYVTWEKYNLPPAIYYVDQEALRENQLHFASYDELKQASVHSDTFYKKYVNVSKIMRDKAVIIHYMGATKPWNRNRKQADTYALFDIPYLHYAAQAENHRGING